jgi:hypothetical protein
MVPRGDGGVGANQADSRVETDWPDGLVQELLEGIFEPLVLPGGDAAVAGGSFEQAEGFVKGLRLAGGEGCVDSTVVALDSLGSGLAGQEITWLDYGFGGI